MIKTYTIVLNIDEYVATTKRERLRSERVNALFEASHASGAVYLEAERLPFRGSNRETPKGTLDFQEAALATLTGLMHNFPSHPRRGEVFIWFPWNQAAACCDPFD